MSNLSLISVVDDDTSVRESLQGLIRSVGLAVEVFASAEEFLKSDHLRNTRCLILDVRMPGMNGLELQRRLAVSHCEIPVIFILTGALEKLLNGSGALGLRVLFSFFFSRALRVRSSRNLNNQAST